MHVMYFTEFAYLRIEITRKLTKYLIIEQAVVVHLLRGAEGSDPSIAHNACKKIKNPLNHLLEGLDSTHK
jgi:hypothetical protein